MPNIFKDFENEPMSAIIHLAGFLLSIVGLVLLIVFASLKGNAWHIVGFTVFGTSLVLLYSASTLYHFMPLTSKAKIVFKRIDHSMIYVLIAGTYTPICFISLQGAWGWTLFGIIWAVAIAGILIKTLGVRIYGWLSTSIYLVMGWLAVIAFIPLRNALSPQGMAWLFAGGIFYSVGAVFYSLSHIKFHKKWFGFHEIWHIFVMLGSLCHFWVVFHYLL